MMSLPTGLWFGLILLATDPDACCEQNSRHTHRVRRVGIKAVTVDSLQAASFVCGGAEFALQPLREMSEERSDSVNGKRTHLCARSDDGKVIFRSGSLVTGDDVDD